MMLLAIFNNQNTRIIKTMVYNRRMIIILVLIFFLVGNMKSLSQNASTLPNFTNLDEITASASSTKIIRAFDEYKVDKEVAALFHKDPALYVFEGDELDKALYLKSQKYLDDKRIWDIKKNQPLCLQVNLKFETSVTDGIKDFTPSGYTLVIASANKHKISKALHQKFMKLGGIYFPTKQSLREDLSEEGLSGNYKFKVACADVDKLMSLRTKVNNTTKDDIFKLVILYSPSCFRDLKITSGHYLAQGTYTYYFGKVLKAYLVFENEIISDLTGLFSVPSPLVIDSAIIPAERSYILNQYK